MQSQNIYSDSSCSSVPASMSIVEYSSCVSSSCTATFIGTSYYYYETTCPSDAKSYAASTYGDTKYLLVDVFSDTECSTYTGTAVIVASGTCEVVGTTGQGVITTVFSNGSAQFQNFLDTSCTVSSSSQYTISKDLLTTHSCFQGFKLYSNADGSTSEGISGTSSSSGAVGTSSTSSGSNTGIIIGVAAGVVVLLLLAGLLCWRCRRNKNKQEIQQIQVPDEEPTDQFYPAPVTPQKTGTASTTLASSDGLPSKLWDDEAIIAARIPREKVVVERLVNRGGFGEVHAGTYNGQRVAIKMLLPERKKSLTQVNAFLSEVKLMSTLDHAHIVAFIGVAWDSLTDLCVVTEFMVIDLKALLSKYEKQRLPTGFDHDKVKVALHVAHALTYLHSCAPPVIHRDLKSSNILLNEQMDAKVTDFGISRERIDATMTAGVGTSLWMAPEVMLGERYDDKADMFSFGVVLSELDQHTLPYSQAKNNSHSGQRLTDTAILQMVAAGKLRVEFSQAAPESIVELGHACVSTDPKDRPTAAEALYRLQTILTREISHRNAGSPNLFAPFNTFVDMFCVEDLASNRSWDGFYLHVRFEHLGFHYGSHATCVFRLIMLGSVYQRFLQTQAKIVGALDFTRIPAVRSSSMRATEVYSDSSCDSPLSLTISSSTACTSSDCAAATIAGSTYYTATSCPSSIYEHTADFYDDTSYLLVDIYSGTDCTTYVESAAFAASGDCEVAGTDGQSVIASLNSNGSAQLTYYLDGSCTMVGSTSFSITGDDLTSHSCQSGRKYYTNTANGVGSSSTSSASGSSSSTSTSDSSSGISGGAIAGIIVGALFVLAIVGVLIYRRKQRRPNQGNSPPDFGQTTDLRDAYHAQGSPAKRHRQTTTTSISDSDRHHQSTTKLWDDDVIVGSRIPREKVKILKLLNRGGYGEVYIGSYHGKQVAVKMLLPETKKTMSQVNAFLSEVKLMASLDHPRIVSFIGVAWDQLIDICVISEYMAGGDLKALLTEYDQQGHPVGFDHNKVKIAFHVSIALTYLHSCAPPVIHRDLKSKNILLDESMNAKVTDFGISRERIDATMTGGIGTSFWMAPEVMMGERYDDKADMFSFGVVLSELDSHVMPYALSKSNSSTESSSDKPNKLPNAAILQMVAAGRLRVHFSEAGPQSMIDLGLACVSLDPNERPTAAEALYKLQQILSKEV